MEKTNKPFFPKKFKAKYLTCLEQNWLTSRKIHIEGEWFNIVSYLYKYIRSCRLLDHKNVSVTIDKSYTNNFNF